MNGARGEGHCRRLPNAADRDRRDLLRRADRRHPGELRIGEPAVLPQTEFGPCTWPRAARGAAVAAVELDLCVGDETGLREHGAEHVEVGEREVANVEAP